MGATTRGLVLTTAIVVAATVAACTEAAASPTGGTAAATPATQGLRVLPSPRLDGPVSLEEALAGRRSQRSFLADPLSDAEVGQLLWAAQGVTDGEGHRTAPSAGALYPLEVYVVTVDGVSRYVPERHALQGLRSGDLRARLRDAALDQAVVGEAPLVIVISGVESRTAARYGDRTSRYVQLEAGHAAQNVLLQAVAMDLGAVPIGAIDDAAVREVIGAAPDDVPLYLLPVGHVR